MESASKRKQRREQIDNTTREINILKEQMSEMQDVLQQILNKVNGN